MILLRLICLSHLFGMVFKFISSLVFFKFIAKDERRGPGMGKNEGNETT